MATRNRLFHHVVQRRLYNVQIIESICARSTIERNPPLVRHNGIASFCSAATVPPIPAPTWSIASLQLDQNHNPVSEEELRKLSKRALIDVSSGGTKNDSFRQDLGNMLHMIQQVREFQAKQEVQVDHKNGAIYDCHRGNGAPSPVRNDDEDNTTEEREAKQVWESFLKPHTIAVGAHSYFIIATDKGIENESS